MMRSVVGTRELPTHVRQRHGRASARARIEQVRGVSNIFAEIGPGPRVAQKTSHAERDRDHDDDRSSGVGV
jgi:hypothetical protein